MEKPLPLLLVLADQSPVEIKKWGPRLYVLMGPGELGVHSWGEWDWELSCLSTEPARRQAAAAHSLPSGRAPGSAVRPALGKGPPALTYIFLALPAEISPANSTKKPQEDLN